MFKWRKKGQIWAPAINNQWMQEYGQNPNAIELADRIRIYFSSRKKDKNDGTYISYIFFIDVDKNNPATVLYEHPEPILNSIGKGNCGDFDEFGTMPGSIVYREDKNEFWLYYVGWQRSNPLPYQWANGLAISQDGINFQKIGNGRPILSILHEYPHLHACPRVYRTANNAWMMWYASGIEWFNHDNRLHPVYIIKNATSQNGIQWELNNTQVIRSIGKKECQSSANLLFYDGIYHMFFSYRDILADLDECKQYRIGYASSSNLIEWHRDDSKAGIEVSSTGWDSEAICYPHVVNVEDKIYMFYSGNQYGRSGFGYAELEK